MAPHATAVCDAGERLRLLFVFIRSNQHAIIITRWRLTTHPSHSSFPTATCRAITTSVREMLAHALRTEIYYVILRCGCMFISQAHFLAICVCCLCESGSNVLSCRRRRRELCARIYLHKNAVAKRQKVVYACVLLIFFFLPFSPRTPPTKNVSNANTYKIVRMHTQQIASRKEARARTPACQTSTRNLRRLQNRRRWQQHCGALAYALLARRNIVVVDDDNDADLPSHRL